MNLARGKSPLTSLVQRHGLCCLVVLDVIPENLDEIHLEIPERESFAEFLSENGEAVD